MKTNVDYINENYPIKLFFTRKIFYRDLSKYLDYSDI